MISPLLAKAYNHVIDQPASKFLASGMMLTAGYNKKRTTIIYSLTRDGEQGPIWSASFELSLYRWVWGDEHPGDPPVGQHDIRAYDHPFPSTTRTGVWRRGTMTVNKIRGDVSQFQRDLIIIRMLVEAENEYDHLKNE